MIFAEQLKGQLDIVDVIGQYVRLKRAGASRRYVGLCPFHTEKTPSFNVNSDGQFYFCFSCHATGDVFKFVQETESLSFWEALKSLAERYGIPVPQRQAQNDPESQLRDGLLEMHEMAADLFQSNLRGSKGADARAYLESRGVSRGFMDEFRLGLSDGSWQQLTTRLQQRFGPEMLRQSGLVLERESGGGFFDVFRGRLMFPIHSEQGKVIAFGARALSPDDTPKYRNSSDTPIYKKSKVLYNFHRAKTDARKQDRLVLVEGYMDAIAVYSAGVREVVAVCGTKLAVDQVRSIKRQIAPQQAQNGHVIFNFDPDAAGANSAEKYIASCLAEGLRVRVMDLPNNLDPDEFIQQQGVDAYLQQVKNARSYFHWLSERVCSRFDMHSAEGRTDAFKAMLPSVRLVSDRVERGAIVTELTTNLKLERDVILEQIRGNKSSRDAVPVTARATASLPQNEVLLLTCMVSSAEARETIKHYLANSQILHLLETRCIFEAVLALEKNGRAFSIDAVSNGLENRFQRIIADLSFSDAEVSADKALGQAIDCLRALELKAQDLRRTELRRRIRALEQEGKLQEAFALMAELDDVRGASSGA